MRKLKLDVEALQVESFEAHPGRIGRGTVAAYYEDPISIVEDPEAVNTVGTCIGPTYCCPVSWDCPVINTNTPASRVMSAFLNPCTCTA